MQKPEGPRSAHAHNRPTIPSQNTHPVIISKELHLLVYSDADMQHVSWGGHGVTTVPVALRCLRREVRGVASTHHSTRHLPVPSVCCKAAWGARGGGSACQLMPSLAVAWVGSPRGDFEQTIREICVCCAYTELLQPCGTPRSVRARCLRAPPREVTAGDPRGVSAHPTWLSLQQHFLVTSVGLPSHPAATARMARAAIRPENSACPSRPRASQSTHKCLSTTISPASGWPPLPVKTTETLCCVGVHSKQAPRWPLAPLTARSFSIRAALGRRY